MQLKDFLDMVHDHNYNEDGFLHEMTEINLNTGAELQIDEKVILELSNLLNKCVNLESFVLSFGFIGINFSNGLIKYSNLFNALKNCKKLNKLDISFNQFGTLVNEDIQAFAEFVQDSELESLNLQDNDLNKLSYEDLNVLFSAISKCKNLQYLDISHNDFHAVGDDKFNLICDSLIACQSLVYFEVFCPYIAKERKNRLLEIKNYVFHRLTSNIGSNIIDKKAFKPWLTSNMGSNIIDKKAFKPLPFFESLNKENSNIDDNLIVNKEEVLNFPKCTIL